MSTTTTPAPRAAKAAPTPRPRRQPTQTAEQLIATGAALLREFWGLERQRTSLMRQIADVVCDLRSKFLTATGTPDWAGRSREYRAAVARMYDQAGIPTDSTAGVQAALRYHIGNALRSRLTPEVLEESGLTRRGPRERQAARQAAAAQLAPPLDRTGWDASQHLLLALQSVNAAMEAPLPTTPEARTQLAANVTGLRIAISRFESRLDQMIPEEMAAAEITTERPSPTLEEAMQAAGPPAKRPSRRTGA